MEETDANSTRSPAWYERFGIRSNKAYIPLNENKKPNLLLSPLLVFTVVFIFLVGAVLLLPKGTTNNGIQHISKSRWDLEKLSRDVTPKPIHSHNDYWRSEPFFTAYKNGALGIEADIWHFTEPLRINSEIPTTLRPGTVYVGHTSEYLLEDRTLRNMYLNPLYSLLEQANSKQTFLNGTQLHIPGEPEISGIYYNDPSQQVYLWFDIKTNPEDTYSQVKPLIQPFIENDWVTYYDVDTNKLVNRPIIITLTGNLPTEMVEKEKKRYFFLDGALSKFKSNPNPQDNLEKLAKLSIVASGSLESLLGATEYAKAQRTELSEGQLNTIKDFFDTCHKYNLKTRIWGGIEWPKYLRDSFNKKLLSIGLDFINTDYVELIAAEF